MKKFFSIIFAVLATANAFPANEKSKERKTMVKNMSRTSRSTTWSSAYSWFTFDPTPTPTIGIPVSTTWSTATPTSSVYSSPTSDSIYSPSSTSIIFGTTFSPEPTTTPDEVGPKFHLDLTNLTMVGMPRINYTERGFEWDLNIGADIDNSGSYSDGQLYSFDLQAFYLSGQNAIPIGCGRLNESIYIAPNAFTNITLDATFSRRNLTITDPVVSNVIATCGFIEDATIQLSFTGKAKYTIFRKPSAPGSVTTEQYVEKAIDTVMGIPCPNFLKEASLKNACKFRDTRDGDH